MEVLVASSQSLTLTFIALELSPPPTGVGGWGGGFLEALHSFSWIDSCFPPPYGFYMTISHGLQCTQLGCSLPTQLLREVTLPHR